MSGPTSQGSSWWAGGKVERKPGSQGSCLFVNHFGGGQNKPLSTIGKAEAKGAGLKLSGGSCRLVCWPGTHFSLRS